MVCRNHFKFKYTRFLIKYHLFIFCLGWIMTCFCMGFFGYKYDQIHWGNLLRGFQAHGTKSSDEYRKLIALLRETQITHLFPHSLNSKTFQQTPYASYQPHINPCNKRFYLPNCPIVPYIELTFALNGNSSSLFDDLHTLKTICKFEWNLRKRFTNCSFTSCCEYVGPVDLLFNGQLFSSDQCENLTINQLVDYHSQWLSCNSSSCSNTHLHHYLSHIQSSIFKIYLHILNNSKKIDFYHHLHSYQFGNEFHLIERKFPSIDEEFLFLHLLENHLPSIYFTILLYLICLLFFVKNLFFILTILQHIFLTLFYTFIIYLSICHFPMTIFNYTSIILYLFLVLIDSVLWYICWFVNNHRRDDCPIYRMMENVLLQTFYYILPKNLTAMMILILTYSNQIIGLQCFIFFAFLLLFLSFFISFILYPVTFILILRYQSTIPTFEHFLHRILTNQLLHCFIDRTIPCLIVRFKAFWLTLLTIVACLSLLVIFKWPGLQYDVCRMTFQALPSYSNSQWIEIEKNVDIDITYYIGSHWEVPNESFIPSEDIPILDYNRENRMTSKPGDILTFQYALEQNLSQLIRFCSQLKSFNRHDHRLHESNSSITLNSLHCFGDLSLTSSNNSFSNTKFSSIITTHYNQSTNCSYLCHSNTYECILCLNSFYYNSLISDDLSLMKNGLRFINDAQYPRYLLQTMNYHWTIMTDRNNYNEWKLLYEYLRNNLVSRFYSNTFTHMSIWWSSELFSTYTMMEQLEQEKFLRIGIKFLTICIFLIVFTGILGIFVTLTTLCNFLTCIAILILFDYKLTIENMSYFTIVLIICSQYSILYSISYKFAPTFFFQRENRTMYSLQQLCTTLFHLTLAIVLISSPCLFSSLPYLSKSAMIYIISSMITWLYSTFFLQSLLCYLGPAEQTCLWRVKLTRRFNRNNSKDLSSRRFSTTSRRHQRMSTSSYFASSYFSQIFTGSTYFESEYGGINDSSINSSRRRESSRSHQFSHAIKRNSLLTGEVIELYTPRASLAPYGHHHHRSSRQSSVPRVLPVTAPTRPLYISPSVSPHSQMSIHSQTASRQYSPSPHSSVRLPTGSTASLRPCLSAPRLHPTQQRTPKQIDTLSKEIPMINNQFGKKTMIVIQRQDAISTMDDIEHQSAAVKRSLLKETAIESTGQIVWLKRSNSS